MLKPTARCAFGVDGERCGWLYVPRQWNTSHDVRTAAKDHLKANPTHDVYVDAVDSTRYYVPAALLAELTAVEPFGDGDDATGAFNPD